MGADRKGPLAAFVVIAVIAAILLVTSVRSQAEPSIVAAPPAVAAPEPWRSVGDEVQQVVEAGVTLVRKAVSDPSEVRARSVTSAAPASTFGGRSGVPVQSAATSPAAHPAVQVTSQPARHLARHSVTQLARHSVTQPARDPATVTSTPLFSGHGRHLGWMQPARSPGHGRHLGWAKR